MEELNTLNSVILEGYKIKRNGEIITLTRKELRDIEHWSIVLKGRGCLEGYEPDNEEEEKVLDKMMEDKETCYSIGYDVLEVCDDYVRDIVSSHLEKYNK